MSQRISEIKRVLQVSTVPNPLKGSSAAFLLGPRQTGKTTLLKQLFPKARYFDLLDTALAAELTVRPRLLRERLLAKPPDTVVIDEIQKVPGLLEEVHFLLENTSIRFILCGSSARKLKRKSKNLLGGRAVEHHLLPLSWWEIPKDPRKNAFPELRRRGAHSARRDDEGLAAPIQGVATPPKGMDRRSKMGSYFSAGPTFDLQRMLNHGGLPTHYLVDTPAPLLRSYVNTYIKEEIIDESLTRNIPSFSRFLEIVGLTHGRQLNFANVARESGVSASTVRNYYQILKDTLLGFELAPWRKSRKRRLVETAKFYLFDIGVANQLNPELGRVDEGTDAYGRAFEHFVINEVRAYLSYRQRDDRLAYWRTSSGLEVDLIVGDMRVALEIKSTREVRGSDLKGPRALLDEHRPEHLVVVSRVDAPRLTDDGIRILPFETFLGELWNGEIV